MGTEKLSIFNNWGFGLTVLRFYLLALMIVLSSLPEKTAATVSNPTSVHIVTSQSGINDNAESSNNYIRSSFRRAIEPGGLLGQSALQAIDHFTLKSVGYVSGMESSFLNEVVPGREVMIHMLDFQGTGNLPPMVLIHGISSCAADFYPIVRQLQSECSRVIAIDLPGHGLSTVSLNYTLIEIEKIMVDSVRLVLKKKNLESCILIGNSLGGFVATRFASKWPKLVKGLVLLSPAGAPLNNEELEELKRLFRMETFGDAASFVDRLIGKPVIPFGFKYFVGWLCRERARQPAVLRILNDITIKTRLQEAELRSIRCPVLLIWGKKETLYGEIHLDWFRDHIPKRLLHLFRPEKLGHVPHLDSAMLSGAICAFCQGNIPTETKLCDEKGSNCQRTDFES